MLTNRFGLSSQRPRSAAGWQINALVEPGVMIGSNGVRLGPDGRLFCAQAMGSQISAVDVASGTVETIESADGAMTSPDDLAFDTTGNLYATQFMSREVCIRTPAGITTSFAGGFTFPNGIAVHNDRLLVGEFNPAGRIMEVYGDGRSPRVIADGQMFPNAMGVSPDGHIYYSHVLPGEIWRVPLEGGVPEKIAGGCFLPTAVKVDGKGLVWIINAGSGLVETLDPVSNERREFVKLEPGIDNFEFAPGGGIFTSHFTDGHITQIGRDGQSRIIVPRAMVGPGGIAATSDGALVVADGLSYAVVDKAGAISRPLTVVEPGAPPYMRGVAVGADGAIYFASPGGTLSRHIPGGATSVLADDLDQPYGIACLPDGEVVVAESGSGEILGFVQGQRRVVAKLHRPIGVAGAAGGGLIASDAGSGCIVAIDDAGGSFNLVTGLAEPHGVASHEQSVFAFDRGTGRVLAHNVTGGATEVIAQGFTTDGQLARPRNVLPGLDGLPLLQGPLGFFSDITVLSGGRLCVGCDADGGIWTLEKQIRSGDSE